MTDRKAENALKEDEKLVKNKQLVYYTMNLNGVGVNHSDTITYQNLDDAVKAYQESDAGGKRIGFSLNGKEVGIAYFGSDGINHMMDKEYIVREFNSATPEEMENILQNVKLLQSVFVPKNEKIQNNVSSESKNNDKKQSDVLSSGEQMEGKITYYAINENEARTAHSMKYYYPYEHGTKTKEYREEVDKIYDMVTKISKVRPEAAETAYQLANQFSKEMADNMNQAIKVECMCPSDMIAGAKNISAKMRKQQDTARMKNQEEYREIKRIEKRLNDILTGKDKIQKITNNPIKESVEKSTEEKESFKQSQQPAEEKDLLQQPIEKSEIKLNNKYFKVVENMELGKLQLTFTGKPNEKMRDILKDNHFHWSWENRAWETSLTDDAKEAVKNVAARFEELEKQGKLELEKLENSKPSYMKNKKFHGKEFQSSNYDHVSLEKQVMLKQNKRIKEQLHDDIGTKLDQTQDTLHQEELGMVEDVDVEIEIGE
ncbi:MAG: hypothetical protein HFG28_06765 [Eubacterium sp.]|nr:hypothetical protein [Eubacterium sp.]